jgi:glycosyltransferase involved in cell wall biosynthesis
LVAGKKYAAMRFLERRIIRQTDHIICPSAFALAHLETFTNKISSSVILPIGRSLSDTARKLAHEQAPGLRQSFGVDDDVPLAVCVARYDIQKDLPTLIDAFEIVMKSYPRARLFIAGSGTDHDRTVIQKHIDKRGVNHGVSLIGYTDQPDTLIAASDVMVLSSIYETVPLVLLEALQLGTPVVMTDVGIAGEILHMPLGQYVPVRDVAQLAQAIETWCSADAANTIDAHRKTREATADSLLDRDACVIPVIDIYQHVISGD